eukprot:g2728.t1
MSTAEEKESDLEGKNNELTDEDEFEKDEEGEKLDPTLVRLFAYCTNDEFNDALEAFCSEHASKYSGAQEHLRNHNGEHKLAWMHIFKEYTTLMESLLDNFLQKENLSASEVYNLIAESVSDGALEGKILPSFILNTNYETFLVNMENISDRQVMTQDAENFDENINTEKESNAAIEGKDEEYYMVDNSSSHSSSSSSSSSSTGSLPASSGDCLPNLSGTYTADPSMYNRKEAENYLKFIGVPWALRKMVHTAAKTTKELIIKHKPNDETPTITFLATVRFFGSHQMTMVLNDVPQTKKNIFGIHVTSRALQKGATVLIRGLGENRDGCAYAENRWTLEKGGTHVSYTLFYKDSNNESVQLKSYFKRKEKRAKRRSWFSGRRLDKK